MNAPVQPAVQKKAPREEEVPGEAEWLEQARAGKLHAWGELHRLYYQRLWTTVNQICSDPALAEDIVQEAFIKAYRQLSRFRGESKFGTWIHRIAVNLTFDALRKRNRRSKWLGFFPFFQEGDEEYAGEPVPIDPSSDAVERSADREAIAQAFEKLSPDHRAVVHLRLIEGYSTEETAKILSVKKGTVLSRLFYATKQLKELLKDSYEERG